MAGGSIGDRDFISDINVTPLVDVMLVLLVVFLVTAHLAADEALTLDLPKAATAEEIESMPVLSVVLPPGGGVLVNGAVVVNDAGLLALAREALAADATLRTVVAADGAVPHREVLHVLDVLKRAGHTRIAFAAESEEPQATP